jgi:hypothetical protein
MGQPNDVLAALLDELGWSPRTLARHINRVYRDGVVSDTAPYHWRDSGVLPRAPVAGLAAHVLSMQLGRTIPPDLLWQGRSGDSSLLLANSGMDDDWSLDGTMKLANDWLRGGLLDRRSFVAVSGVALARAVWAFLREDARLKVAPNLTGVDEPDSLVGQIEQSVPMLQALDDIHGGAAHLGYVGAQVRAIALVLNEGGYHGSSQRRLLMALADLGQLAGWKAFDALQHGLAQRYFFTALRASYDAGYKTMAAHTLADLAVQEVTRENGTDAVALGEAAARHARSAPAGVRACVRSRLAHAYAASGRIREFERETAGALEDVADRRDDADPAWLYYLTPAHIECQAGYSYVLAGRRGVNSNDRARRALLRRGGQLLQQGAHDASLDDPSQRRALYEGAWLALGYSASGRLDEACAVAETAVRRLPTVQSPRSVGLLRTLENDLSRRRRSPVVSAVLPELSSALARQPA